MKLKNIFIGLACCAALCLSTACTDLDETVYDALTDETIDTEDENVVGFMMGEALANFRYIYWTWNGYFDLQEECGDLYCTPKRIGVGWGDLYINMHKHNWTSSQEHPYNLWYNGYVGQCRPSRHTEGYDDRYGRSFHPRSSQHTQRPACQFHRLHDTGSHS